MLHRVTWYAAGVLALVVIGTSVGYWGYNQKQQRDAYVRTAETGYDNSFHNLVSDFNGMRSEMADSLLTADETTFVSHLAGVSRFAYAAGADLSKLPDSPDSTGQLHNYLHTVDSSVKSWLKQNHVVSDRAVRKQLATDYSESGKIQTELTDVQSQLTSKQGIWMNTNGSAHSEALALTGLKKIDGDIAKTSTETAPQATTSTSNTSSAGRATSRISTQQAINMVAKYAHVKHPSGWKVKAIKTEKVGSAYEVTGDNGTGQGTISGEVSRSGTLLSFYDNRPVRDQKVDFVSASKNALSWLHAHGYAHVHQSDASQYDNTAVFTFTPQYDDIPVISHPIQIHVALDNGQVTGFNAVAAALHPVTQVANPKLTVSQLRQKLSADFDVKMEQSIITRNSNGTYVPAVAFYGTFKGDTFSIYLSRVDGSELEVQKLT